MKKVYILTMQSSEIEYAHWDIDNICVFQNKENAYTVQKFLNDFVECNFNLISGNPREPKGHEQLFVRNMDKLYGVLSGYFEKSSYENLIGNIISLSCVSGISNTPFKIMELNMLD